MAIPTAPTAPGVTGAASAPPARTQPAKRPDIKLSAPREESRFVGPLPMAIGLIAVVATLGFAFRFSGKVDDPNYVRAKESVGLYEIGIAETERNYDSSIYQEALAALAKVEPGSISAGPAAALAADIKLKTDAFHRRVNARVVADEALRQARIARDQAFMDAHQRDLVMPKKDFPECREEGSGHAH